MSSGSAEPSTTVGCRGTDRRTADRRARRRGRRPGGRPPRRPAGLVPTAAGRAEDPAVAAALVAGTLRFCDGLAARRRDGRLVGFLTGFEQVTDPTAPMARYLPARASVMLVQGHAVAARRRPGPGLRRRSSARSPAQRLERRHRRPRRARADRHAGGRGGVGRPRLRPGQHRRRARPEPPTGRPHRPTSTCRIATPDDLDVVDRLVDEEAVFHAGSPIFRPYLREQTADAVRAELADQLASDDHAFLVARRERRRRRRAVGRARPIGSPLYIPDGAVYIARDGRRAHRARRRRRRRARRRRASTGRATTATAPPACTSRRPTALSTLVLAGRRLHPGDGPPAAAPRRAHPHRPPTGLSVRRPAGRRRS